MSLQIKSLAVLVGFLASAVLSACSDQPKPDPQQAAPAAKRPEAFPEQFVTIKDWGPRETKRGEAVNRQPDGSSAIWIGAVGVAPEGAAVRFGDQQISQATVTRDLVTAQVPKPVIEAAGEYPVVIQEPSGRRTQVGVFKVTQ